MNVPVLFVFALLVAVVVADNSLSMNSSVSAVLPVGGSATYTVKVPLDYRGLAQAFWVKMTVDEACVIDVNTTLPDSYTSNGNYTFTETGAWAPVAFNDLGNVSNAGVWTVQLTSYANSSIGYVLDVIPMPTVDLQLDTVYQVWENLEYNVFSWGDENQPAQALMVNVYVPPLPAPYTGCSVSVSFDPLCCGGSASSQWVFANTSLSIPMPGLSGSPFSNDTINAQAWTGFYPIGLNPTNMAVRSLDINASACPLPINVTFQAIQPVPLQIGAQATVIDFDIVPIFISQTYIATVQNPASDYTVEVAYVSGNCGYIAYTGNDFNAPLTNGGFDVLGGAFMNSTADVQTSTGPAQKTFIWTVSFLSNTPSQLQHCQISLRAY